MSFLVLILIFGFGYAVGFVACLGFIFFKDVRKEFLD